MGFIKDLFGAGTSKLPEEDYININIEKDVGKTAKIIVRPFILRGFDDVEKILESLREGFTIALIDIKHLRAKDIVELKRAISKLKKTCEAIGGEVAGFGENIVIVTPNFVRVYRSEKVANVESLEKRAYRDSRK